MTAPSTGTATTIALDDPEATDVDLAGGKAATLSRLLRDGFPVPGGFVVPTTTVQRWFAGHAASEAPTIPDEDRRALAGALEALGAGPVAVRSSAVGEDAAEASFAGQYETVLDVEGIVALVEALATVLDSARGVEVASYRAVLGSGETALAILVQQMVPARAAGVAFSANPVTGDRDEVLVSAVPGSGESLVGGEIDPDEFVYRDGSVASSATPHGSIDADQVGEIATLARRLEELLAAPQDIEWAIGPDGLTLLQARPITALPVAPDRELPEGSWTKDTVHYPEPLTTVGGVFLEALEKGSTLMCEEWGLLVDHLEQRSIGGEVYGRPVPIGGDKSGPPPPWWLLAVLVRMHPAMRRRMRNARQMVESGALESLPRRWESELKPQIRSRIGAMQGVDLSQATDDELLTHLDDTIELLVEGQRVHFRLLIPYAVGVHELCRLTEDLLGWSVGETSELLQGLSTASSEPAQALDELARLVHEQPRAARVLDHPDHDLLGELEQVAPDVAAAVRTYRDSWGLRAVNYDPGAPTIAERPVLLAGLLRDALERVGATARRGVGAIRDAAERRAREQLQRRGVAADDRRRYEEALVYARTVYPLREDNLFWTDNVPTALVRMAVLEIGDRLAHRGRLGRADDAVWLEVDELRRELRGTPTHEDIPATIRRRRGERRHVRSEPGPDVIGPRPSPPPDLRGLPSAARRINQALMWLMDLEGYMPGDDEGEQRRDADLAGTPASGGRHTGTVRVIRGEGDFHRLGPGDVLVAPITAAAWSVLFAQAGAVVTEAGGVLSHAAIVAREHGIPAVLSVEDVTIQLQDGQTVTVDGSAGTITIEEQDS